MKLDPERIFRIANSLGWKIQFAPLNKNSLTYQNGTLTLANIRPKDVALRPASIAIEVVQVIAHEIGHYLAAPPSRRHKKNYGIRRDPPRNPDYWDLDDMKARLVERELMHACGMKQHFPFVIQGRYQKPATLWWEQEGKHLVAGLLLIK